MVGVIVPPAPVVLLISLGQVLVINVIVMRLDDPLIIVRLFGRTIRAVFDAAGTASHKDQ
jgi:hypothetical protein